MDDWYSKLLIDCDMSDVLTLIASGFLINYWCQFFKVALITIYDFIKEKRGNKK